MENNIKDKVIDCPGAYAVGKSITFSPSPGDQLTAHILKTINVDDNIRLSHSDNVASQTNRELFAKFFDPFYYSPNNDEFKGSSSDYTKLQHTKEVKS